MSKAGQCALACRQCHRQHLENETFSARRHYSTRAGTSHPKRRCSVTAVCEEQNMAKDRWRDDERQRWERDRDRYWREGTRRQDFGEREREYGRREYGDDSSR